MRRAAPAPSPLALISLAPTLLAPTLLALALLALAACAPQDAPDAPAADLARTLSGAAFACREGEQVWTAEFAPDGAYAYVFEGRRHVGRWRVDGPGRLCTLDDGWPEEQCYSVADRRGGIRATREDGGEFVCDRA